MTPGGLYAGFYRQQMERSRSGPVASVLRIDDAEVGN